MSILEPGYRVWKVMPYWQGFGSDLPEKKPDPDPTLIKKMDPEPAYDKNGSGNDPRKLIWLLVLPIFDLLKLIFFFFLDILIIFFNFGKKKLQEKVDYKRDFNSCCSDRIRIRPYFDNLIRVHPIHPYPQSWI